MNLGEQRRWTARRHAVSTAVMLTLASITTTTSAFDIDAGPDWTVRWDNTISYNLGMRAQSIDPNIGNHPAFAQSDYSHPNRGDIVTNRVSNLMELDAQNRNGYGARFSASMFKDFAFNDGVRTSPGEIAPGTPYSALGSYTNNQFSGYTKRYYKEGARVLDAFAYSNFKLGERDASVMGGRLTKFWGNAVFFGPLGINYSQNAADNIKASFAPGTEAKELAIPREQLYVSGQITPDLVAEAQYFFRFQGNLLPQGGTYLSFGDFLTAGPQGAALSGSFGLGQLGRAVEPKNNNQNFGLKLSYAPSWLRGAASVYYRQFDETQPWIPLLNVVANDYHIGYAQKVKLLGFSLEKQVGAYSVGAELLHRRGTGLNSSAFNPNDLQGREGARGNVTNLIVNAVGGLTRSPLWDTGVFLAELAFTHLDDVTSNASMYSGVGTAACPGGTRNDGCSTRSALMAAVFFKPQWLSVMPSVDLGLPIFVMHGIDGNAAVLGIPVGQRNTLFTVGLEALVQQKYTITLQYNGYHYPTNGLTNAGAANGVPNGTPGFPTFYAGGNRTWMYNDKGWVSLTLKASF